MVQLMFFCMSLIDGYGVLIGRLHRYDCDDGRSEKEYYHCNIQVKTGKGVYRCAVDLDSKNQDDGFHWRTIDLGRSDMHGVVDFDNGWHYLRSEPDSGALDYIRSPELQVTDVCRKAGKKALPEDSTACVPWKYGTGLDAFGDLLLVLEGSIKLQVFGEPFRRGKGVHNIHQNQGDPPESRWSRENGIWQDGAVAGVRRDRTVRVFLSRFKTQATRTDERGKPISS